MQPTKNNEDTMEPESNWLHRQLEEAAREVASWPEWKRVNLRRQVITKEQDMQCRYCGRDRTLPCHNTRDMDDFAVEGDDDCLGVLQAMGGGERGIERVLAERLAKRNKVSSVSPKQRLMTAVTVARQKFRDTQHPNYTLSGETRDFISFLMDECETAIREAADVERTRLQAILERDRTKVAECFQQIMAAIRRHAWLCEGRGSYEWNDDTWRDEFGAAIKEIKEAAVPLQRIAADWNECPTDWAQE